MKNLGETYAYHVAYGAEGECENSQAKGPDLDDTLENVLAPTKQFPVTFYYGTGENLSGKHTEAY